jgi:DNA-directed RNA polymerase subunit RPC12/RpoP
MNYPKCWRCGDSLDGANGYRQHMLWCKSCFYLFKDQFIQWGILSPYETVDTWWVENHGYTYWSENYWGPENSNEFWQKLNSIERLVCHQCGGKHL